MYVYNIYYVYCTVHHHCGDYTAFLCIWLYGLYMVSVRLYTVHRYNNIYYVFTGNFNNEIT